MGVGFGRGHTCEGGLSRWDAFCRCVLRGESPSCVGLLAERLAMTTGFWLVAMVVIRGFGRGFLAGVAR